MFLYLSGDSYTTPEGQGHNTTRGNDSPAACGESFFVAAARALRDSGVNLPQVNQLLLLLLLTATVLLYTTHPTAL